MNVLDPGHRYELTTYDVPECAEGQCFSVLQFMKREGDGYPGNVGTSPGTNLQEVLRALIDRVEYLNNQIRHPNNLKILAHLRASLWLLEERAAERHGLAIPPEPLWPEVEPTCSKCGHVVCPHVD